MMPLVLSTLSEKNAPDVHVAFGASYKEGASLMHLRRASKVDLVLVHNIERPWLKDQDVPHIDLVHLSLAAVDEGGNRATEV